MAETFDTLGVEDEAPTIYVDNLYVPTHRRLKHGAAIEVFTHSLIAALAGGLVNESRNGGTAKPRRGRGLAAHTVHPATPRVRPRVVVVTTSRTDRDSTRDHYKYGVGAFGGFATWRTPLDVARDLQPAVAKVRQDILPSSGPFWRKGSRVLTPDSIRKVIAPILIVDQHRFRPSSYRVAQIMTDVGNAVLANECAVLDLDPTCMPALALGGLELTRQPDATAPDARPSAPAL